MNSAFSRLIKNLLARAKYDVKIGKGSFCCIRSVFEGRNVIFENTEISRSVIGYATYIANCSIIRNTKIGKFCSIGDQVRTCMGLHPSRDFVSTHPAFFSISDPVGLNFVHQQRFEEHRFADEEKKYVVIIGNDVWVGNNVLIFDGVNIGDGAIVGAGAVVTKNVEPYTIVAGIPALPIRRRFSDTQISRLLALQWWNWKLERIKAYSKSFNSVDEFVEKVGQ